ILIIGNIGWTMGSLYSKYTSNKVAASVISAWQMISAGLIFLVVSLIDKTIFTMQWQQVPLESWLAVGYLIIFGSIIGYSAYVFLLSVRNATQVSSYAYVNPVVAVILGVFINKEHLTFWQLIGLVIILCSVFFINKARRVNKKYAGEVKKSEEQ
ncbi:MAG TPA: EamA family transporter, partial [Niabella sp.]|nr:EamA family transporter [Niabella sp.]